MILSHEDGNTSYVKNIHKPTVWPAAGCIYSRCVALIVIIMLFTKACLGSGFADLSNVCGPLFYPVKFKNQCLYLDDQLTRNICDTPRTFLGLPNNPIHLKFCNKYTLNHILPQDSPWDGRRVGGGCNETMIELVNSDNRAREEFELFVSLLERVDCDSVYSVTWGCSICQKAYRDWLCTQHIPVFSRNSPPSRIPPCGDFCSGVEHKCPFLRPLTETTYAGEPSFICKDPSSDMVPSLSEQCYKQCYLTDDKNAKCLRQFPSRHNVSAALYTNTTESNSCCSLTTNSLTRMCVYLIGFVFVRTVLLFYSIGLT